jgi:peptide/nickel transport system permease protein
LLVLFWAVIAIFAAVIAPPTTSQSQRDPYQIERTSFSSLPSPPSERARFGTTGGGYDIFYGVVWGSRTALKVSIIVVSCSAVVGVLIGGIGAFIGGIVDELVMRVVDLLMSLPFLIAVMVMAIALGKGLDKVIIALVIFGWRSYARLVRSRVLSVKQQDYVLAAKAMGGKMGWIFLHHILPNSIQPTFVLASVEMGRIILVVAALSFIGVGAEPGYADWGQLINFARGWIIGSGNNSLEYWYTVLFPALAILSYALGWILLGDALRDVLDPRLRGRGGC